MKHIITLILCLFALSASAQSQQQIIKQISTAAQQMKTMQCSFTQTKHLKMLNDKMVSKGRMYYQQPNKLRWEYTTPYTYTFILNDTKVLLKKGTRNDVINVNQNKMFREIARMMMNSVVGQCLTDTKSFKTTIATTATEYVATLLPQKKDMKQMWTKLVVHFNRQKAVVSTVEMYEKNGDSTVIEMQNVKTNTPVSATVFSIN